MLPQVRKALIDSIKWKPSWRKWKIGIASDETRRKMRETRKWTNIWANNPQWKWWLSFQPYTTDRTITLRRSIREREIIFVRYVINNNEIEHFQYIILIMIKKTVIQQI
jgi:hypothetical protein